MMGEILGFERDLPYAERTEKLREGGIALWDVAKLCLRKKSSDATIRDVEANDFGAFFQACPILDRILFNGAKAFDMFRKLVVPSLRWPAEPLALERLPSTSPAFAAMTPQIKADLWRASLS
jgi:hypoxanthine-DNA glycosylase